MKTHYKQFQRYLRQNMPRPEIIIWQSICQKQLGVKFRRQYTIGNRIVDFYAPQIKLAIEIDGDSHFESDTSRKKEIENDNQLKKEGITVIRFLNSDVMKNLDGVLGHIRTCLDPHLNPPPQEREDDRGFTLIEMIIYIGIVGLFLTAISLMALEVTSGQAKAVVTQEVQQNLRLSNNLISQDIQSAQDITSPAPGASDSTLVLDNGASDAITYTVTGNILTRQVGSNPAVSLTTDNVFVTVTFENLSYNDRSRNVGVSLRMDFDNPTTNVDFDASASATYAVELKGRR